MNEALVHGSHIHCFLSVPRPLLHWEVHGIVAGRGFPEQNDLEAGPAYRRDDVLFGLFRELKKCHFEALLSHGHVFSLLHSNEERIQVDAMSLLQEADK